MRRSALRRPVPRLTTEEEAEAFLDQELSDFNLSRLEPALFAFEKKSERIDMRVPKPLLDALKERASHLGIPYTRFIRDIMDREISRPDR
jgi:predicted DNA binding CopG/RHH family protein